LVKLSPEEGAVSFLHNDDLRRTDRQFWNNLTTRRALDRNRKPFGSHFEKRITQVGLEFLSEGTLVNCKAAEKYTGNDEFDLLVLYPAGFARELHFDISVR
jgi:hypothetical protein